MTVITAVTVGLIKGGEPERTSITCASADTDVAAGATIPARTVYLDILPIGGAAFVTYGEATTASIGQPCAEGVVTTIPILPGGGDNKVHAQSPTAATVVHIAYKVQ
jgi:hypothetical protein